jgi:hypothetical protein
MRFLVYPLICGGVCALIASIKRRSVLAWFFLGLFLHIFAIVVLLFLPSLQGIRSKGAQFVKCPKCNGTMRLDAQRCPYCGKDVRPIDVGKVKVE